VLEKNLYKFLTSGKSFTLTFFLQTFDILFTKILHFLYKDFTFSLQSFYKDFTIFLHAFVQKTCKFLQIFCACNNCANKVGMIFAGACVEIFGQKICGCVGTIVAIARTMPTMFACAFFLGQKIGNPVGTVLACACTLRAKVLHARVTETFPILFWY